MGKIRRLALTIGLSAAVCVDAGVALADPGDDDEGRGAKATNVESSRTARRNESPEERVARRRERLEQGAKKLRDRAAELRKKAAAGETPPTSPNAKRPPRSYAEQAQRLEEQASRMDERAKNLDETSARPSRGRDRSGSARDRRQRVRRLQLNRRWGDTLENPKAIAELETHARRTAKLKRIRSLALKKGKDDPVAERAAQLLTREVARHEKHMKELQAKSVAASVSGATTAPAAASEPATAEESEK